MTPQISKQGFWKIESAAKALLSKWAQADNDLIYEELSEPECLVLISRHDDWPLGDVLKLAYAEGANQIRVHLPVNVKKMPADRELEILVTGAIVHEAVHVIQNSTNVDRFKIHSRVQKKWRQCMEEEFGSDYPKSVNLAEYWLDAYYIGFEIESHAAQFAAERKLNGNQEGEAEKRVRCRLGSRYDQLEKYPCFDTLFQGYMRAW